MTLSLECCVQGCIDIHRTSSKSHPFYYSLISRSGSAHTHTSFLRSRRLLRPHSPRLTDHFALIRLLGHAPRSCFPSLRDIQPNKLCPFSATPSDFKKSTASLRCLKWKEHTTFCPNQHQPRSSSPSSRVATQPMTSSHWHGRAATCTMCGLQTPPPFCGVSCPGRLR